MKKILFLLILAQCLHAQWRVVDSLVVDARIPAKKRCVIGFSHGVDSLEIKLPDALLTEKAVRAVAYAPSWLKIDLEDALSGLSAALQDRYAQILLDAKDPYADEVAFTIAHLSPEILTHNQFYPDVILENARGVYSSDSVLEYVDIVNTGTAAAGGEYYSTTKYRVEENGVIGEHTLPRDIYYWYIVHPKLQGEMVSYISTTSGSPAAAPGGKFWRTYLFNYKEGQYTALRDAMAGMKTLWNCKRNDPPNNGALGRLCEWCNKIMPWGSAKSPRIPQPVLLYHRHTGTCSEHGWFANGAARCVLIPSALTKAAQFDHKWNEFYERGWKNWEPVNGWINRQANDYWENPEKFLNGCFNWRGDGFIWETTERYSAVCTLNVSVKDANDRPVDGAAVTIDADGIGGPFCLIGWTGSSGLCRFLLGDKISYFAAAIQSGVGSKASQNVISDSKPNTVYKYDSKLSGALPRLKARPYAADTGGDYRIDYSVLAATEIVYGKHTYSFDGYSFPCRFADARQGGTLDFFICDKENFDVYAGGGSFDATGIRTDAASVDTSFGIPKQKAWYAVLSNEDKAVATAVVSVRAKLLKKGSAPVLHAAADGSCPRLSVRNSLRQGVVFSYPDDFGRPVSLSIYDVRGRLVWHAVPPRTRAGETSIVWNDGGRGVFYYRLKMGDREARGTVVMAKGGTQ